LFSENKYQAGKIILKTKMSSPISARLSEFGWEPIYEFFDRQRVNYFAIFDEFNNAETGTLVVWQNIDNYEENFSDSINKIILVNFLH
jgi:hypothetical protein